MLLALLSGTSHEGSAGVVQDTHSLEAVLILLTQLAPLEAETAAAWPAAAQS